MNEFKRYDITLGARKSINDKVNSLYETITKKKKKTKYFPSRYNTELWN